MLQLVIQRFYSADDALPQFSIAYSAEVSKSVGETVTASEFHCDYRGDVLSRGREQSFSAAIRRCVEELATTFPPRPTQ